VTVTESEVPAGWYPDPDDGGVSQRYWGGEGWSEHTRPAAMAGSAGSRHATFKRLAASSGAAEALETPATTQAPVPAEAEHEVESDVAAEPSVPAGWYPDPDDGGVSGRYWDGAAWTERTRSTVRPTPGSGRPATRAAAPSEAPAPAETAPEPAAESTSERDSSEHSLVAASSAAEEATTSASASHEPTAQPEDAVASNSVAPETAEADETMVLDAVPEREQSAEPVDEHVPVKPLGVADGAASPEKGEGSDLRAQAPSAEAAAVPAGWYPDPDDHGASHRYWDGEDWTEQTRPAAGPAAGSDSSPPSSPPQTSSQPVPEPAHAVPTGSPQWEPNGAPGVQPAGLALSSAGPTPVSYRQPEASAPPKRWWHPLARLVGLRGHAAATMPHGDSAQRERDIESFRQMEQGRLELLLGAVWANAMDGDVPSVLAAARLIETRSRLLGLDVPGPLEQGSSPVLDGRQE
jgi:hypothetical protein